MKKMFVSIVASIVMGITGSVFAEDAMKTPKVETPNSIIKDKAMVVNAPLPSDYFMGKKDAPVVMIEYASLTCPHCAHFYASIMPDLKKNYVDTGKVLYILRQFPLNYPALKGAILVNCVGETQGSEKYYLFNKVLFDSQSRWAFDGNWRSGLQKIAAIGGVNQEQFDKCIDDKERETAVLESKKKAMDELGVPHTPYFFIGGEAYSGDKTVADMSKFIDAKLAK